MKRSVSSILLPLLLCVSVFSGAANAAWIWTPETKKFTNPKNAVKDTPKEQFEWAMRYYDAKDYQRAAFEFDKLAKQYEFSDYASKAQYYVGLCYENLQKYYTAYENYQKAIDNFPHLSNTDEVLAREYAIGLLYLEKPSPKVMGTDIMAPLDRAAEIFKKVVDNAPYGKYAEDAQFKLGETLKKSERYEEAIQAYHKITEDYPNSKYATQAMYEESYCAYRASLKPAYDATATDNAIKTFEKFTDKNKDASLAQKADSTMKRLKDNVAQKSFDVAKFYESQGKTAAAIIYYQDVIDNYPESSFVKEAKARVDALKNGSVKKARAAPLNLDKKKPKDLTGPSEKKLSWNPFRWPGKQQEKKQPPQGQEPPKKRGWRPFSFEEKNQPRQPPVQTPPIKTEVQTQAIEAPKTEPSQPAEVPAEVKEQAPAPAPEPPKTEAPAQVAEVQKQEEPVPSPQVQAPKAEEKPKKKSWTPFNFEDKKAGKPADKKPVEKKPWKPISLFGSKKQGPAGKESAENKPLEKKPWNPLGMFGSKKKESATQETVEKKPVEKKPWKPLRFFGSNNHKEINTAVKAEEPQAAQPAAEQVTKVVEKISIESDGQVVESTKVNNLVPEQAVEAPKAESVDQSQPEITKKEEPVPTTVPAKKKGWTPLRFDKDNNAKKSQPAVKKGWRPLYFGTNDEPMTQGSR